MSRVTNAEQPASRCFSNAVCFVQPSKCIYFSYIIWHIIIKLNPPTLPLSKFFVVVVRVSHLVWVLITICDFLFDSGGDLSASASSDILSASLIGVSKKQFIMMPPEEKLTLVDRRAQDHEDKQEVGGRQGTEIRVCFLNILVQFLQPAEE